MEYNKEAIESVVKDFICKNFDNGILRYDNQPKLMLTIKEMAALMNISLPTAYGLTKDKDFPSMRIGKKLLVNYELLKQWINEHTPSYERKHCNGE